MTEADATVAGMVSSFTRFHKAWSSWHLEVLPSLHLQSGLEKQDEEKESATFDNHMTRRAVPIC